MKKHDAASLDMAVAFDGRRVSSAWSVALPGQTRHFTQPQLLLSF
jgi:hypothetical protein